MAREEARRKPSGAADRDFDSLLRQRMADDDAFAQQCISDKDHVSGAPRVTNSHAARERLTSLNDPAGRFSHTAFAACPTGTERVPVDFNSFGEKHTRFYGCNCCSLLLDSILPLRGDDMYRGAR